jgi:hypothetical protein
MSFITILQLTPQSFGQLPLKKGEQNLSPIEKTTGIQQSIEPVFKVKERFSPPFLRRGAGVVTPFLRRGAGWFVSQSLEPSPVSKRLPFSEILEVNNSCK